MAGKSVPLLLFWAAICLAQPLGTGAISGTVVEGQSDEGVHKAIVTLTLEGEPRRWATARTDGSGHFQFDGLPAGRYTLQAAINNEGAATYGAKSVHELGDSITLAEGEIRGGLILRFLRGASIEGRVFDTDGDPVGDASVTLLRRGRNRGEPILVTYRGASSDERGEYHFTEVDPGRYCIRVSPGGPKFIGIPNSQRVPSNQYYGGARDSKDAAPVHVSEGERLKDIDFRLMSEPAVKIQGQVLGVPEDAQGESESSPAHPKVSELVLSGGRQAGPGIQIRISPEDAELFRRTQGTVALGPDYRFEMEGMPAGRYRIDAALQSGGKSYGASEIVDIGSDSNNIVLTLAPAVEIHGTLKVEAQGVRTEEHAAMGAARIDLQKPGGVGTSVSAEVGADGRFTLPAVIPGEWNLEVNPGARGFVKSARFGDKDARFATFEVGPNNEATLNIVMSLRTAAIEGEIEGGGPATAKRAGVLVARADDLHAFTRFYYKTEADADGKFHLDGIAPGKYEIFALEGVDANEFLDPDAVEALGNLGETVDLAEGATVKAHPKLIPKERALKALQ